MQFFKVKAQAGVNPQDVAEYILQRVGPMSAMKLQKLLYYCQAWHLVWKEKELFAEDFEAWANGPVLRSLYDKHRGVYRIESGFFKGDPKKLSDDERVVIDEVLNFYGDKDPQWLSDLTHAESPWKDARGDLGDGERSGKPISKAAMLEYYSSLK